MEHALWEFAFKMGNLANITVPQIIGHTDYRSHWPISTRSSLVSYWTNILSMM